MPENWKEYKLKDLTSVITKGTTPSTYGFNFEESGINYIRAQSLSYDGKIDESAFSFISEEAHKKLKRSQLQPGDILFSMAGAYLGMTGMVKASFCPANTNQAIGIIRIKNPSVSPKFVEYLLRNPSTVSFVNAQSGQSAQPNINLAEIGNLAFEFPPLEEQKSIASVLSALDDKIELNLQMNQTMEQMAMALYKHWFVDFGPFQDGDFVATELGEIPKGWKVLELGEVSTLGAGGDKPKTFSKQSNEKCKIPIFSNGISNEGLYGFTDQPKIYDESITVSARGTIGFVCLRMEPYVPIVRLISIVPKKEFTSSKYLFLWLKIQNITGTGTTQQQLTVPDFKKTKILIPSIELVNNFTSPINDFFDKIVSNKDENKTLTQLRDTLLPKLISGEVRVKDVEKTLSEVL